VIVTISKPIVAVVDDDPRMLESLEDLLESGGYSARTFSSARSLLERGLAELDLLITDIGMPGMDGLELHEHARSARPDLPVFLITGRHELAEQGRAQDARGFFRKPFDAPALLSAIGDAIRERRIGGQS
jgi:FixJ family two-component response regulator